MGRLYHKLAKKAIIAVTLIANILFTQNGVHALTLNDPNYRDQKKFYDQISMENAWDASVGSKKIVVAFIDTGLDIWHEDIKDNVWTNYDEILGNQMDDDLNGYVDDINGWNFVENNNLVRPDVFNSENDKEAVRHGTLVGGLIGAKGNNSILGTGVAQNIALMSLRAIRSDGSGSAKAVSDSIDYAVENGASIINLSFMGDKFDQGIFDHLKNAYKKGVLIVSAAGNFDSEIENGDTGSRPIYPGCFDSEEKNNENWILTVGSVDEADKPSTFSEYGKCVDIFAPGEYIYSTERYAPQYGYLNEFGGPWFGTSFSAPLVAGTAALIKSIHPEYTPSEIIQTIISTADSIELSGGAITPENKVLRLNAGRALEIAKATPLKRGMGVVGYFKNKQLKVFDLKDQKSTTIIRSSQPTVIAFTNYSKYLDEKFAVISKQNNKYSLNLYNSNNVLIKSETLPNNIFYQNTIIKYNGSGFYIISKQFNKKNNTINIVFYNTATKKIKNLSMKGSIVYFDVNNQGKVFAAAYKNFVLTIYDASNLKSVYSLNNVAKVYDFKITDKSALILLAKGSRVALINLNLNNYNDNLRVVSSNTKAVWNLNILNFADTMYYFPHLSSPGNYVIYDNELNEASTLGFSNN